MKFCEITCTFGVLRLKIRCVKTLSASAFSENIQMLWDRQTSKTLQDPFHINPKKKLNQKQEEVHSLVFIHSASTALPNNKFAVCSSTSLYRHHTHKPPMNSSTTFHCSMCTIRQAKTKQSALQYLLISVFLNVRHKMKPALVFTSVNLYFSQICTFSCHKF